MKTWELIKLLQEEDPLNKCDVTVGNEPVSWIESLPYYYDGRLQAVCRVNGEPVWAGYPKNRKIKIHTDSVEEAIMDNPDVYIDVSGISYNGSVTESYAESLEKMRAEGRELQVWIKEMRSAKENGLPLPPLVIDKPNWRKRLGSWLKEIGLIE